MRKAHWSQIKKTYQDSAGADKISHCIQDWVTQPNEFLEQQTGHVRPAGEAKKLPTGMDINAGLGETQEWILIKKRWNTMNSGTMVNKFKLDDEVHEGRGAYFDELLKLWRCLHLYLTPSTLLRRCGDWKEKRAHPPQNPTVSKDCWADGRPNQ